MNNTDVEQSANFILLHGAVRIAQEEFDDEMAQLAGALVHQSTSRGLVLEGDSVFALRSKHRTWVICNAIMEFDTDDESGLPWQTRNIDIHVGSDPLDVKPDRIYDLPMGFRLTVLDPSLIAETEIQIEEAND